MREEIAFVTDIHRLHTTYYRLQTTHTHTDNFPPIYKYILMIRKDHSVENNRLV